MDGKYLFLIKEYSHLFEASTVILFSLVVDFIQRKALRGLAMRAAKTKSSWDDDLIEAARKPVSLFIWVIGLSFSVKIAQGEIDSKILEVVGPVREAFILTAFVWFLLRFTNRVERSILNQGDADQTTVDAVCKLVKFSITFIGVLGVMQALGFSISGVLAFGGISGIAIGFAAKDLLANFFGGLMIYLDRPFSVGDWIRSPDREIEGTVEQIGWRLTRIRTFDKRPLYIPNGVFANIALENPQRMLNRRIYETIGIRYEDAPKIANIVSKVREMLVDHPEIDSQKTLIVNLVSFAPSSLDFFVYTFTKTTDWIHYHEVKQDILIKILNIIGDYGAQTAYPTSTVHLPHSLESRYNSK
tara:strand:- start:431 stop:1504 length:1074 start_codon:yes stop_codon:yes gene_type:complete